MAYVNSRSTTLGFADRLGATLRVVKEALARRQVYNQTMNELKMLSDRDLADLGLNRLTIADVAREAAYK